MGVTALVATVMLANVPGSNTLPDLETAVIATRPVSVQAPDALVPRAVNQAAPDQSAVTGLRPAPAALAPDAGQDQGAIVVSGRRSAGAPDPLATVNIKAYEATQAVDMAVIGPIALAYARVIPAPLRDGLRNVLGNLHEPTVFINFILQHKLGKAGETAGRFVVNSTIGGLGLFDIARRRPFHLPRRPNGFADTMGFYGIKPGTYLFLPLVGPTTLRDLVGGVLDRLVLPTAIGKPFNRSYYTIPTGLLGALDHRVQFDEQLRRIRDQTANPYIARRDFYLQKRQAEIDELRGKPGTPTSACAGACPP